MGAALSLELPAGAADGATQLARHPGANRCRCGGCDDQRREGHQEGQVHRVPEPRCSVHVCFLSGGVWHREPSRGFVTS